MALHPISRTAFRNDAVPLPPGKGPAVPQPPHGLRRAWQDVVGFSDVVRQMPGAWKSSIWLRPKQITVPIPQGSSATPPKTEPRGVAASLKRLVMMNGTYLKHVAFPTMARSQEVVGYVAAISHGRDTDDGDITFNVVPLPQYQGVLYYKGKLRPHSADRLDDWERFQSVRGNQLNVVAGSIHCEIKVDRQAALTPFIHQVQSALLAGNAPVVSVTGRWTFDPFHAGTVEIHPVRDAKVLSFTGTGYPEPLPLPQPVPVVKYKPD